MNIVFIRTSFSQETKNICNAEYRKNPLYLFLKNKKRRCISFAQVVVASDALRVHREEHNGKYHILVRLIFFDAKETGHRESWCVFHQEFVESHQLFLTMHTKFCGPVNKFLVKWDLLPLTKVQYKYYCNQNIDQGFNYQATLFSSMYSTYCLEKSWLRQHP